MRPRLYRGYGPLVCVRMTVAGHTFGLNLFGKGTFGKRYIMWARHWRPAVCDPTDPFDEPWGDC